MACINAAGGTVHIFPSIWFAQNPMEGCIEGAYFGKSDNRLAIDDRKLQPAQVYEADKKPTKPTAAQLALSALEEELDEEMLTKYKTRLAARRV